jgi:CheY-like chemotaxis protein
MASKILVLDDEENYTRMLRDLLEQHRYQVVTATMPEKALELLKETAFDLVVSDYKMPVMDGAAFLKNARKIYPDLPVILVSGLMNTPELVKVANMSVTLVFEKPLNTQDFLQSVRRFATPLEAEKETSPGIESELMPGDSQASFDFPSPLYFAAECLLSRITLQQVWEASKEGEWMAFWQPEGGDAELLVKELAVWHAGDRALSSNFFEAEDIEADAGMRTLEQVLLSSTASPVFGVRVNDRQLSDLNGQKLLDFIERDSGGKLKPVFILTESEPGQLPPSSLTFANKRVRVISVPPLVLRPSDLALYSRRFAAQAVSVDRDLTENVFSEQVAFALLCHDWPGNLSELSAVIKALVKRSENGVIQCETVRSLLAPRSEFSLPSCEIEPQQRLEIYLQLRQRVFLRAWQSCNKLIASDLARQLAIADAESITDKDLLDAGLINPEWARLV